MQLFNRKENCCGCTACANICPINAISMQSDDEGFLYPYINSELCINCEICAYVCPFRNNININGYFLNPIVYAVKHKANNVRMVSSSGGAFTAITDAIIKNNSLYAIYGAIFDKTADFFVRHERASTSTERDSFRGSKYIQSNLGSIFKTIYQDLISERTVLFSGTPCQTAGLYNYLEQHINTEEIGKFTQQLYLIDLICHGVASPFLWNKYIQYLQSKYKSKLKEYIFRAKEIGWHGYNIKLLFNDGTAKTNTFCAKIYSRLYSSGLIIRPACYECRFANTLRPSDITIGDFWGIERIFPMLDDNKGISLVIINTIKGNLLFERIKDDIEYYQCNINDCEQSNLKKPTRLPPKRNRFWKMFRKYGFNYIILKSAYCNFKQIYNQLKKILRDTLNFKKETKE